MSATEVLSPVEGLQRLLMPGIDLFNHDANSMHRFRVLWTLNPEYDGLFKVVAGAPIKKGEEVFICYGGNPNRPEGCGGDCTGDIPWNNGQYIQRYGFHCRNLGTLMVDGKWLWEDTEDMSEVREALTQTAQQEDEALLKDESLSPGSRTAIEYRLWLKRAQEAQKESAAQIKEACISIYIYIKQCM